MLPVVKWRQNYHLISTSLIESSVIQYTEFTVVAITGIKSHGG
jgi:hypothetical protein